MCSEREREARKLYTSCSLLQETELAVLQSAIEETRINHSPLFTVGGYRVHELLGSGAFGNVYKVSWKTTTSLIISTCTKPNVLLTVLGQETEF